MAQYINKEALVAEINRQYNYLREHPGTYGAGFILGFRQACWQMLDFLDTLEGKEVDFETAFAASIDHFDEKNNYGQWPESDLREFAEHFFELGLNYIKSNKNE